jgi:hypothetical protein
MPLTATAVAARRGDGMCAVVTCIDDWVMNVTTRCCAVWRGTRLPACLPDGI